MPLQSITKPSGKRQAASGKRLVSYEDFLRNCFKYNRWSWSDPLLDQAASKNRRESVCTNRKTIARKILEHMVLSVLLIHLVRDEFVQVFYEE